VFILVSFGNPRVLDSYILVHLIRYLILVWQFHFKFLTLEPTQDKK